MPVTIGSNITSMRAQRQLLQTSSTLGGSLMRLSTGQRINTASDDAAGLAVSEGLRVDSRVMTVARRNVNDGLSAIAIAAAALGAQKDILIRLGELAEQSANGTFNYQQRKAMDSEYQALVTEFGRIGVTTSFNGRALLREDRRQTGTAFSIQAGLDSSGSSQLDVRLTDSGPLSGTIEVAGNLAGNEYFNSFETAWLTQNITCMDDLLTKAGASVMNSEVSASDGSTRELFFFFTKQKSSFLDPYEDLNVLGIQVDQEGRKSGICYATEFGAADGDPNQLITDTVDFGSGVTASLSLDLRHVNIVKIGSAAHETAASALEFSGVETQGRARNALEVVSNRLSEVVSNIGALGAGEMRLAAAAAMLGASHENHEMAAARIRDTDIAGETAQLLRSTILQQAASAVLTQANQQPALVLSLLD